MMGRLPRWMLEGMPPVPVPEQCYRWFWWRKGDVFRLFMSLSNVIDGCTWLQQDAMHVNELIGLIRHVTGVHADSLAAASSTDTMAVLAHDRAKTLVLGMAAGKRLAVYFAEDTVGSTLGSCGLRVWRRSGGCCHVARRCCCCYGRKCAVGAWQSTGP